MLLEEAADQQKKQAERQFVEVWEEIEMLVNNKERVWKREQRRAHWARQKDVGTQDLIKIITEESRQNMVEELVW